MPIHAAMPAPDQVESLPPEWRMESDDDYSYDADYAPPPPVKGLAVHGYVADDSIAVADGTVILTAPETCPAPATFRFPRTLPPGLPERTTREFWFYRSGDQALYLSRRWVYEVDSACQGAAREVTGSSGSSGSTAPPPSSNGRTEAPPASRPKGSGKTRPMRSRVGC